MRPGAGSTWRWRSARGRTAPTASLPGRCRSQLRTRRRRCRATRRRTGPHDLMASLNRDRLPRLARARGLWITPDTRAMIGRENNTSPPSGGERMRALLIAAVAALAAGPLAAVAEDGPGHCAYVQKNMFAGPFK